MWPQGLSKWRNSDEAVGKYHLVYIRWLGYRLRVHCGWIGNVRHNHRDPVWTSMFACIEQCLSFGSTIENSDGSGALSLLMNVIWICIGGVWIALTHLILGVLLLYHRGHPIWDATF